MYSTRITNPSASGRAKIRLDEDLFQELLRRLRAPVPSGYGDDASPAERVRTHLDTVLGVGGYADAYEVVAATKPTVVCRLNVQGVVRTGIACASAHDEAQDLAFLKAAEGLGIDA